MLNPTNWALQAKVARRWGWLNPPRLLVEAGAILAFVAAILATNIALTSFPNVKLFDLMVFLAGYALGLRRGSRRGSPVLDGLRQLQPIWPYYPASPGNGYGLGDGICRRGRFGEKDRPPDERSGPAKPGKPSVR